MCYTGTPSGEGVFFRNYRRKARGHLTEGCGGNLGIQKDSVLERCYEQ